MDVIRSLVRRRLCSKLTRDGTDVHRVCNGFYCVGPHPTRVTLDFRADFLRCTTFREDVPYVFDFPYGDPDFFRAALRRVRVLLSSEPTAPA